MSLHARLLAEKDFPGLWPHHGPVAERAARVVLAAAGLAPEDATPASPSVRVRVTVAYWHGVHVLHDWLAARVDVADGCDSWVDRELLIEVRDYAMKMLGTAEDLDGSWSAIAVQLGRVLTNPRLEGCAFFYVPSF